MEKKRCPMPTVFIQINAKDTLYTQTEPHIIGNRVSSETVHIIRIKHKDQQSRETVRSSDLGISEIGNGIGCLFQDQATASISHVGDYLNIFDSDYCVSQK